MGHQGDFSVCHSRYPAANKEQWWTDSKITTWRLHRLVISIERNWTTFPANIKTVTSCKAIPIVKMRRSWARLTFMMGIPTLVENKNKKPLANGQLTAKLPLFTWRLGQIISPDQISPERFPHNSLYLFGPIIVRTRRSSTVYLLRRPQINMSCNDRHYRVYGKQLFSTLNSSRPSDAYN